MPKAGSKKTQADQNVEKEPSTKIKPDVAVTQDQIAERAYQIYLERAGQKGTAMDDWLEAERELLSGNGRDKKQTT